MSLRNLSRVALNHFSSRKFGVYNLESFKSPRDGIALVFEKKIYLFIIKKNHETYRLRTRIKIQELVTGPKGPTRK